MEDRWTEAGLTCTKAKRFRFIVVPGLVVNNSQQVHSTNRCSTGPPIPQRNESRGIIAVVFHERRHSGQAKVILKLDRRTSGSPTLRHWLSFHDASLN